MIRQVYQSDITGKIYTDLVSAQNDESKEFSNQMKEQQFSSSYYKTQFEKESANLAEFRAHYIQTDNVSTHWKDELSQILKKMQAICNIDSFDMEERKQCNKTNQTET